MSKNEDFLGNDTNLGDLISFSRAAEIAGLSQSHLRRLAGQKKLWAKKIGRNWVTTEESVLAYLQSDRKPGPKHPEE